MNPITCTFAPCIYTDTGKNNLINWINTGFSNYNFTMDGKIHRLFTRLCIDHLLHPFQTWIMGQKAFPNKFAKMMKIPLVIYGENPEENFVEPTTPPPYDNSPEVEEETVGLWQSILDFFNRLFRWNW